MTITVIVELVVREQKRDQVLPLFQALISGTRGRRGNLGVTVHQDQDNSCLIMLIERWKNRETYEEYNLWRREKGDLDRLAKFLSAAPERRFFNHLPV